MRPGGCLGQFRIHHQQPRGRLSTTFWPGPVAGLFFAYLETGLSGFSLRGKEPRGRPEELARPCVSFAHFVFVVFAAAVPKMQQCNKGAEKSIKALYYFIFVDADADADADAAAAATRNLH
jgi:hypothetical protein